MIHSLSGGIIADNGKLTYCKVRITFGIHSGEVRWYISPFPSVKEGDAVCVPFGKGLSCEGVVERVDVVSPQTAPYPVNRTAEIERIVRR